LGGTLVDNGQKQDPLFGGKVRGQVYSVKGKKTRIINVDPVGFENRNNLWCSSQNYVSIGDELYIVYPNKIIIFDMIKEEFIKVNSQNFIDTSVDSTELTDNSGNTIALCTDNNDYLFIASQQRLYILNRFEYNVIDSKPLLTGTGYTHRRYHSCAFANKAIYVIGSWGYPNSNPNTNAAAMSTGIQKSVLMLDDYNNIDAVRPFGWLNNNKGSQLTNYGRFPQLLVGQRVHVSSNKIFIFMGASGNLNNKGNGFVGSNVIKYIDPTNDRVTQNKGSIGKASIFGSIIERKGRIYVCGGSTDSGNPSLGQSSIQESKESLTAECDNPYRNQVRRRLQGTGGFNFGSNPDPHFISIYNTRFDFHVQT